MLSFIIYNNENKFPVFPERICNKWHNMMQQTSQAHNHGKIWQHICLLQVTISEEYYVSPQRRETRLSSMQITINNILWTVFIISPIEEPVTTPIQHHWRCMTSSKPDEYHGSCFCWWKVCWRIQSLPAHWISLKPLYSNKYQAELEERHAAWGHNSVGFKSCPPQVVDNYTADKVGAVWYLWVWILPHPFFMN